MITIDELKIGNYVKTDDGLSLTIRSITSGHIGGLTIHEKKLKHRIGNIPISNIEAIALTQEILLKSKFVYSGRDDKYSYFRHLTAQIGIAHYDGNFYFKYSDKIGDLILHGDIAIDIKSVHQLQNLYAALTGEKLDIRL